MEFLHHGWIFDHGKVKTEDDGSSLLVLGRIVSI
jgi:hypothetical protein